MEQISRIYFHLQEAQDHITFNSSQVFKTHTSATLLISNNCFLGNDGGGANTVINCGETHSAMEHLLCIF